MHIGFCHTLGADEGRLRAICAVGAPERSERIGARRSKLTDLDVAVDHATGVAVRERACDVGREAGGGRLAELFGDI